MKYMSISPCHFCLHCPRPEHCVAGPPHGGQAAGRRQCEGGDVENVQLFILSFMYTSTNHLKALGR